MARARKSVVWAGDTDNCGHCAGAKEFLSANRVKNSYYHVDTPRGSKLLERAKSEAIPTFQICDVTPRGQKKDCHFVEGFDQRTLKKELGI